MKVLSPGRLAAERVVYSLHELPADPDVVGGKAASLRRLLARGVPVPPTAVIPIGVYRRAVAVEGYAPDGAAAFIERIDVGELEQAVAQFARDRFGDVTLAVRSSSNLEDLTDRSFAGQYESYLDVRIADAGHAIRNCWKSLWSETAVAYRSGTPRDAGMAVILQPFIRGHRSGVAFSMNPITGNPFEIVIDHAAGDCSHVTDGDAPTELLTVDVRRALHGRLPPEPFATVCRVCLLLDRPVDLEWTADREGRVTILQERPAIIRSTFPLPRTDALAEFQLALPEAFSPLGASLELHKNRIYSSALQRLVNPRYRRRMVSAYGRQFLKTEHDKLAHSGAALALVLLRAAFTIPAYVRMRSLRASRDLAHVDPSPVVTITALARNYLDFYERSIAPGFLYNVATGALVRYAAYVTGGHIERSLLHNLLAVDDTVATRRLTRLDELASLYMTSDADDWLGIQSEEFRRLYAQFCDEFGYVFVDTNPRDPYAEIDHKLAHRLIAGFAAPRADRLSAEYPKSVAELERLSWWHRTVFRAALIAYRRIAPIKEERNHEFYGLVALLKKHIREQGHVIARELSLGRPDDVFFLTLGEIAQKKVDPARIAIRRRMYDLSRAYLDPHGRVEKQQPLSEVFRGIPCSPGRARGPVVVLRTRADFDRIRPGSILVTDNVRPFWTPVLGLAAGIVASTGSLLSHGASIAREYGIPAVFGLGDVVFALSEGQVITLDGTTGVVSIESAETLPGGGVRNEGAGR